MAFEKVREKLAKKQPGEAASVADILAIADALYATIAVKIEGGKVTDKRNRTSASAPEKTAAGTPPPAQ